MGFGLVSCKKGDAKTVISGAIQLAGAVFNHIKFIINTEVGKLEEVHLEVEESYSYLAYTDSFANLKFSLSANNEYIGAIWVNYGTNGCE